MRIYQVDSFAEKPFEGNPAGVCVLPGPADEKWMQNVAMEMNLAETAFLYAANGGYNLRWFTPEAEVDLCGHATLAAAHILFETGALPMDGEAVFFSKSGKLSARKEGETIRLDFPAEADEPTELPGALRNALRGAGIFYCGKNRMDYIVEIVNDEQLKRLQPDMQELKTLGRRGVIVTCASSDPAYDFISRFFAPGVGIPEDPVTGSAHCCLGPYWQRKLGKSAFSAYQASKRGGKLQVEVKGDRVMIGGKAVTVFRIDIDA
jgi:PhzF family phenazine biosynthesis protein